MSPAPDKPDLPLLRHHLAAGCRGVLAPASGGCVQYLLSADVEVRRAANGQLRVQAPDRNANQQQLLNQTTLSLRIPLRVEHDGTEREMLVLTGHLRPDTGSSDGSHHFVAVRSHTVDVSGAIHSFPVEYLGMESES